MFIYLLQETLKCFQFCVPPWLRVLVTTRALLSQPSLWLVCVGVCGCHVSYVSHATSLWKGDLRNTASKRHCDFQRTCFCPQVTLHPSFLGVVPQLCSKATATETCFVVSKTTVRSSHKSVGLTQGVRWIRPYGGFRKNLSLLSSVSPSNLTLEAVSSSLWSHLCFALTSCVSFPFLSRIYPVLGKDTSHWI